MGCGDAEAAEEEGEAGEGRLLSRFKLKGISCNEEIQLRVAGRVAVGVPRMGGGRGWRGD